MLLIAVKYSTARVSVRVWSAVREPEKSRIAVDSIKLSLDGVTDHFRKSKVSGKGSCTFLVSYSGRRIGVPQRAAEVLRSV